MMLGSGLVLARWRVCPVSPCRRHLAVHPSRRLYHHLLIPEPLQHRGPAVQLAGRYQQYV